MRPKPAFRPSRLPLLIAILLFGTIFIDDSSGDRLSAAPGSSEGVVERLVIHYSNGAFELVSWVPLNKILPRTTALPAGAAETAGAWYEVQDASGKVLYRRFMSSAASLRVETPDGDIPGAIRRSDVAVSETYFSILVPTHPAPRTLVFFDGDRLGKRLAPSTEVGRLELE